MRRKVFTIGNSKGVCIPLRKKKYPKSVDSEFVTHVNDFIERYRPALKELAKK